MRRPVERELHALPRLGERRPDTALPDQDLIDFHARRPLGRVCQGRTLQCGECGRDSCLHQQVDRLLDIGLGESVRDKHFQSRFGLAHPWWLAGGILCVHGVSELEGGDGNYSAPENPIRNCGFGLMRSSAAPVGSHNSYGSGISHALQALRKGFCLV